MSELSTHRRTTHAQRTHRQRPSARRSRPPSRASARAQVGRPQRAGHMASPIGSANTSARRA